MNVELSTHYSNTKSMTIVPLYTCSCMVYFEGILISVCIFADLACTANIYTQGDMHAAAISRRLKSQKSF